MLISTAYAQGMGMLDQNTLIQFLPLILIFAVARVDNPEEVIVDIADGVRVRVLRGTITSVLAKPDPAAAREAAKQKEEARAKAGPKE